VLVQWFLWQWYRAALRFDRLCRRLYTHRKGHVAERLRSKYVAWQAIVTWESYYAAHFHFYKCEPDWA
jgi:hypothetical protein